MTASLSETQANWQELSSSEDDHSQVLFASNESTSEVLLPMSRPDTGSAPTSPGAQYLRQVNSEGVSYLKIDNWGQLAPKGRFNFCVKIEADISGTTLISKPRLEAYDSFDSAFTGKAPESPILTGTTNTNDLPLLRAIDLTAEALGLDDTPNWPPSQWWVDPSLAFGTTDNKRIKYIKGIESFLEPGIVIVPEGGDTIIEDVTYTASSSRVSSEFYFSFSTIIPDDVLRGQSKKDIVIILRTYFA